jgi:hypothetical protein
MREVWRFWHRGSGRRERDLDDELQLVVDELIARNLARG